MVNGGNGDTTTSASPAASGTVTSRTISAVFAYTVTVVILLGAGFTTSLSLSLSCAPVRVPDRNSAMPRAKSESRGNMTGNSERARRGRAGLFGCARELDVELAEEVHRAFGNRSHVPFG